MSRAPQNVVRGLRHHMRDAEVQVHIWWDFRQ
jgi:hypothetical protein